MRTLTIIVEPMKRNLEISYEHYDNTADMDIVDQVLISEAQAATENANAPYSNFKVGAAVRLRSGRTFHASNFESEVYPAGLCAERTLLYHHQATTPGDKIVALAIASNPSIRECYPCGQCRQVLVDVERRQGSPIRVIMSGNGSASVIESAQLLLPFTFQL